MIMEKEKNTFFAMLDRMKYIERWSLMNNLEKENLKEHTFDVILLVHALITIRKIYFPENQPQLDPGEAVLFALYHDASEIITGDLPTPIKYFNPGIKEQYKIVESYADNVLLEQLPEKLRQEYAKYFNNEDELTADSKQKITILKFVKYADTLSAYIKCVNELKLGNREFNEAAISTKEKLKAYQSDEVNFFLENIMPTYELSLDQLQN